MSLRTIRKIMLSFLLVSIAFLGIPLLFQCSETVQTICIVIGMALFVGFFLLSSQWRCPHCDRRFPIRGDWWTMEYCPYCGEEIEFI